MPGKFQTDQFQESKDLRWSSTQNNGRDWERHPRSQHPGVLLQHINGIYLNSLECRFPEIWLVYSFLLSEYTFPIKKHNTEAWLGIDLRHFNPEYSPQVINRPNSHKMLDEKMPRRPNKGTVFYTAFKNGVSSAAIG